MQLRALKTTEIHVLVIFSWKKTVKHYLIKNRIKYTQFSEHFFEYNPNKIQTLTYKTKRNTRYFNKIYLVITI